MEKSEALNIIKDFVEGTIDIKKFEDICKHNQEFRAVIKGYNEDVRIGKKYDNEIVNMIDGCNWEYIPQQYNIYSIFYVYLLINNVKDIHKTDYYRNRLMSYDDYIPDWLSDDAMTYAEEEIVQKAPKELSEAQRKKWIKNKIKETFKYEKRPPEFAQEGIWPQDEEGNYLIFVKQKENGDKVTYKFKNPKTKEEVEVFEYL